MISSTVKNPNGMPATLTVNDSYKFTAYQHTSTATGGGSFISAGPIDNGVTE